MSGYKSSNWGDWIGSQLAGPEWTPYAQAIADRYPIQVPWFYTLPSNLVEGSPAQDRKTVFTAPQQHDVLILGAYAITRTEDGDPRYVLLNITHEETGIPWVVPNTVGYAPVGAFAGLRDATSGANPFPSTRLKLPEAFFLPKYNRLKLDWAQSSLDINTAFDVRFTFIGVQLIGADAPTEIKMPDGNTIPVGARLPWFITLVMGERSQFEQWIDWVISNNTDSMQFTSPQDCEIEIHDCFFNLLVSTGSSGYSAKLTEFGDVGIWTPQQSQINTFAGEDRQVNPAMPFTKPFLLKEDHRLGITERATGLSFNPRLWTMLTFRGVRLCGF